MMTFRKFPVLIFFLAGLFLASTAYSQGWRPGEMELRVTLKQRSELKPLLDITKNIEAASSNALQFRVYVTPEERERIISAGFISEVLIPDLNDHYRNFWDNPMVPSGYYTYDQIIAIADSLAANFPSICKKELWGNSVGGRQLAALKISDNVNTDENEAEIMFDGGIHGDEVGGSQNVIMFARKLCLGYGTNTVVTEAVNTREIWLFLMVNPDGRVSMSRYNQNGVDCNRDNGYMWDGEGFSPSANSQPETKTLRDAILRNQFTCYTNYHSGIEIISYPWSYRSNAPRDQLHIDLLANVYSSASGYAGGMVYGQGYNIMYAINGSTKDFQYGSLGNVGWSIEISTDKQPPASQVQHFYDINEPAMLEVIKKCGWGIEGLVTDTLTGLPIRASVWANEYYPVYTDPAVGDYHKFMAPGTYSLTVKANGYLSKTISGVVVPAQGSVVTNVQMVPDTGWYAEKVISCRIPGNNFGDEGYTPGCLGTPDEIPYAIGKNGWVILDFGDTLYNGPGPDMTIFQSGTVNKSFTVSGSQVVDGPFAVIGTGSGTTSFDLPSSILKIRYLYIKDNGTGSASGPGAGFNLDAVKMLTPPLKADFTSDNQNPCTLEGISFQDHSAGNPVSWSWSFPGGNPSSSLLQNPEGIEYSNPGNYPVTLTVSNGISSVTTTKTAFISAKASPLVNIGNDTIICAGDQLNLHAGNPGATFLWSTGDTTASILVDSTGTGLGTALYWVQVTGKNGCVTSDSIEVIYDPCTGSDEKNALNGISVWPNPAETVLNIDLRYPVTGKWEILNEIGMNLKSGIILSEIGRLTMDVSALPAGTYLISIHQQGEAAFIGKFIKH
jgi:PKD repeat protein